jgi:hypothetical protein
MFKGMIFVAVLVISTGFAVEASLADSMSDQNCRGGAIPCTKQCGPTIIDSYSANEVNYTVISESAEINLLAGKSTQFDSSCQIGFKAISGGYKLIEDGTTIDLDEIKINGTWAATDASTGLSGWNVWIYRDKGGQPDNCLNLEVHSICMQAQ